MSNLTLFNNQIENLIDDLQTIFPGNSELEYGKEKFLTLKKMNAKLVFEYFKTYVYPHKDKITNKDDGFFLNQYDTGVKDNNYLQKILNIKELWTTKMTTNDKETVWKYFNVLIILVERSM